MPTLTIDNRTVTVPAGTNVLQAAERLGIVIPHFCYHEALGSVGACRLCAMNFIEGSLRGIHMSCMVEAKDNMVVSTLDAEAAELRSHVIEWLMVNHPHDCPVCDEGGECQLQDMTIAGGHSHRRFRGLKRTYINQSMGPLIEQEMNRCIQCYRCVRTYQDYCGGTDFGVLGANQRIFFGRFKEGPLESPFSGNLVDVCPTGVFTDKTFRFKTRYWDLEEAPSICPHCSLGCSVIPGAHYRQSQRVRAGVNRRTNGFFICDRGRFGHDYANHPARPRQPRLEGRECTWGEALQEVMIRVDQLIQQYGPQSVAFLGSSRSSVEAQALLANWSSQFKGIPPVFECHWDRDQAARLTASKLKRYACSLDDIRHSDFVLLIGADPIAEGPMLATAVRQVARLGGEVAVLDPRPVELPCHAANIPLPLERLPVALKALTEGHTGSLPRQEAVLLEGVLASLKKAARPVLIGGADLLGGTGVELLFELAAAMSREHRPCGAMVLLSGPNSYGGAIFCQNAPLFSRILDKILNRQIRGLICLEADPFRDTPNPGRAQLALSNLELLVTMDCLPTSAGKRADIFLPTTASYESGGAFINNEGRLLAFDPAYSPGVPIETTGEGDHPPRTFRHDTPGDQPYPAWAIIARLLNIPLNLNTVRQHIETFDPRLSGLAQIKAGEEGKRLDIDVLPPAEPAQPFPQCEPEGTLPVLPVEQFIGSEILSSQSRFLTSIAPEPTLLLHEEEAGALNLTKGEEAILVSPYGQTRVQIQISTRMARGTAILPRLRQSGLELLVPGHGPVDCVIRKGAAP